MNKANPLHGFANGLVHLFGRHAIPASVLVIAIVKGRQGGVFHLNFAHGGFYHG
jgi:hypothetical protein